MRPQQKTLLGMGEGPDERELRRLMEQEKPQSTKGKEDTIKYLSDPALLAVDVNAQAAEASKVEETPVEKPAETALFVKELKPGSHTTTANIDGMPVLMGDFCNGEFKGAGSEQRMLMGLPRVSFSDDHLRITGLEVNSPSGLNRDKIKEMIIGKFRANQGIEGAVDPGLKPGMLDELKVDLDTKTRKLNTVTSGNGARCYVLSKKFTEKVGMDTYYDVKDAIVDASQVEDLQLSSGDIIFVGSKKVLDALVMGTTASIDTSRDYYESALANQLNGILRNCRDKEGKLDPTAVFEEIDQIYQLEMTVNPKEELVASSFVVYQVK